MSTQKQHTSDVLAQLKKLGLTSPSRPIRFALEPRIVFDGAAPALVGEVVSQVDDGAASAAPFAPEAPAAELANALLALSPEKTGATGAKSVVFIDAAVSDADTLPKAAQPGAEIVMLSDDSDGMTQIADYLAGRSGIESIHILSHGASGRLNLGNAVVNATSLAGEHGDEMAAIRASLTDSADLFIYGCDVAAGDHGQAFVAALAAATGADVAASTDETGATNLGGDWDLEASDGTIESRGLFAPEYRSLLAPLTITPVGTGGVTAMTIAQQLMGANMTVNSATLFGQNSQAGIFSGATGYTPAWLAFDSGVIFSSGNASGLDTSNTFDDISTGPVTFNGGGTAQFTALSGGIPSYNASYLDVTFTPTTNRIAIQFVFGSDEYNEFVYGGVADAMGIWVNGTNIALTPSGAEIGVDTINQSGIFTPGAGPSAAPSLFVNNDLQNGGGIIPTEMDGFTRTLGATITVNPGVSNTLRLGIADIGDGIWDSWFLVNERTRYRGSAPPRDRGEWCG